MYRLISIQERGIYQGSFLSLRKDPSVAVVSIQTTFEGFGINSKEAQQNC